MVRLFVVILLMIAEQIENLTTSWLQKWKERDYDYLDELLHDEFRFFGSTIRKEGIDKKEWFALARNYSLEYFECTPIVVNHSGVTVIARFHLKMRAKPAMSNELLLYDTFDVWILEEGKWKVIARKVQALN